ncbi:MAG: hypothetical protein JSR92_19950 [Proteobacteria bacterium]|nr:hypothetical protein [Pseudomonadota bacterium]
MKATLRQPHTHAGIAHPAGAVIEVDAPTHAWLIERGVISPRARFDAGVPEIPVRAFSDSRFPSPDSRLSTKE